MNAERVEQKVEQEHEEEHGDAQRCFLCREYCQRETERKCEKCRIAACSDQHFSLHFESDGEFCYPYKVSRKESIGRVLIAARKIKAGELIFRETPLTFGPLHESQPVCLTCLKKVQYEYQHLDRVHEKYLMHCKYSGRSLISPRIINPAV